MRQPPNSSSEQGWAARARAIAGFETDNFVELARIGKLEPTVDFRFKDWSGCNFVNCELGSVIGVSTLGFEALGSVAIGEAARDIAPFDFTSARLLNCDFTGARIAGARFDRAEIDRAHPYAKLDPQRTNLRAAADWDDYIRSWQRSDIPLDDSHLPVGAVFQDAPFAPEMVVVPSGGITFDPSDEKLERLLKTFGIEYALGTQREISIAYRLAVGRFVVTFEEWDWAQDHPDWRRLSGTIERRPSDRGWGRGRRPVIGVSWFDAQGYARWLSGVTGQNYRLLFEDEWEYCCRAGTTTDYAFGHTITTGQAQVGAKQISEVGTFPSNAWGFYDMHGNVWEWCEGPSADKYDDRAGSAQHDIAVVRGGSAFDRLQDISSHSCDRYHPGTRGHFVGFRLARALSS